MLSAAGRFLHDLSQRFEEDLKNDQPSEGGLAVLRSSDVAQYIYRHFKQCDHGLRFSLTPKFIPSSLLPTFSFAHSP